MREIHAYIGEKTTNICGGGAAGQKSKLGQMDEIDRMPNQRWLKMIKKVNGNNMR